MKAGQEVATLSSIEQRKSPTRVLNYKLPLNLALPIKQACVHCPAFALTLLLKSF